MAEAFQLTRTAALKYDDHIVPALFAPLAHETMERVDLPDGAAVLDIACGTGALTREIAGRLGGAGQIVAVDLNDAMLEVARDRHPDAAHEADYMAADVTDLPFEDGSFDYAFLQQGLQYFPDKPAALREIARVLRPRGTLVLTCWRALSPYSLALGAAMERHVSEASAVKTRAPFSFRDGAVITRLLQEAAFDITLHDAVVVQRRLDDLREQMMALPIEKDMLEAGETVIRTVVQEVSDALRDYLQGGVYVVPQEAHLFCAARSDRAP